MALEPVVPIISHDYWFKIVDFLQQNWAVIDPIEPAGVIVWFFGDTSGLFDEMTFPSEHEAEDALRRNGFRRYAGDREAGKFLTVPKPPFHRQPHPNGAIYSSGRFWK